MQALASILSYLGYLSKNRDAILQEAMALEKKWPPVLESRDEPGKIKNNINEFFNSQFMQQHGEKKIDLVGLKGHIYNIRHHSHDELPTTEMKVLAQWLTDHCRQILPGN